MNRFFLSFLKLVRNVKFTKKKTVKRPDFTEKKMFYGLFLAPLLL